MQTKDYKSALKQLGVISFVPIGNSMWPTVKGGKNTVVVQAKTERLNKGDVALFITQNKYVLHRVVELTENGYVTRGDSMNTVETVQEEQVIGVMSGFYNGERYVDVADAKYLQRVDRWFNRKRLRAFRLFFFRLGQQIKGALARIFRIRKRY